MIVRDTVYPLSLPPVSGGIQNSTASYPSYFKLHVRWLHLLTPVAYALYAAGVYAVSPPSCSSNYCGFRAGDVELCGQTAGVLRDDQLFVGRDNHGRTGAFFVDEARLAEAGSKVTLMVNFKAQYAQFAQRQLTHHRGVFHRYHR